MGLAQFRWDEHRIEIKGGIRLNFVKKPDKTKPGTKE